MNKRNLQNSELDAIGRKLIQRGGSPRADIDEIISNPDLFSLVNARIAAEGKTPEAKQFPGSYVFSFVRRNAIAFAGIAVIAAAVIAAMSLTKTEKDLIAANAVQHPAAVTPVAAPPDVFPPQVKDRDLTTGGAQDRDISYEKAAVKQTSTAEVRRPQKHVHAEPDPDFYAISYDPNDAATDERIIRVNVKRSTLFAMGINVPLENDDEVVKADLLVGSDGVTRAIRVIK